MAQFRVAPYSAVTQFSVIPYSAGSHFSAVPIVRRESTVTTLLVLQSTTVLHHPGIYSAGSHFSAGMVIPG